MSTSLLLHRYNDKPVAQDMARTESNNVWLAERSDIVQMYREIMGETLKKSRATILQVESIWILKLSGLNCTIMIIIIIVIDYFRSWDLCTSNAIHYTVNISYSMLRVQYSDNDKW